MEEKKKFHIRHIEIYILIFIAAIVVATIFFVRACTSIDEKTPGYYAITGIYNKDIPTYSSAYRFNYYFDGNSKQINNDYNDLTYIYSENLAPLYALTDDDRSYREYINIYDINEHINEEVTIDSRLYSILQDAYNKTMNSDNYSLFAIPLYSFWYQSFAFSDLDSKVDRDPVNSVISTEFLHNVSLYIHDTNHIDLEFLADYKVKLKVSEAYQNFLKEEELPPSYMGLNILRDSYILDRITTIIKEKGYTKGFIENSDGLSIALGGIEYTYGFKNLDLTTIGYVDLPSPISISSLRRYDFKTSSVSNYYQFEKDGVTYYRSIYIDTNTGVNNNAYLYSTIYSPNFSLVEATFTNNELALCNSISEIREYLNMHELGEAKIITYMSNDKANIYASTAIYNFISKIEGLEYSLIEF